MARIEVHKPGDLFEHGSIYHQKTARSEQLELQKWG